LAGTWFTYGNAGPPKGNAFYDYRHRFTYFQEGCCSWGREVLASGVSLPPKHLAARDLSHIRTKIGAHLGDSIGRIRKLYGAAPLLKATALPESGLLTYYVRYPWPPTTSTPSPSCGQTQNFAFEKRRLTYIELFRGC